MHHFGIDHHADIAYHSRTKGNHNGGRTEIAGSLQHGHESKEEPHEQQCHLWPVCLNHLSDVIIEIVHRHFLQATASPLHEVIHLGVLPCLERILRIGISSVNEKTLNIADSTLSTIAQPIYLL